MAGEGTEDTEDTEEEIEEETEEEAEGTAEDEGVVNPVATGMGKGGGSSTPLIVAEI